MKLLRILTKLLLAIALLAFLLFSAATLRFIKAYYDETFRRSTLPGSTPYLLYSDAQSQYDRELLSFSSGKNQLQGYLYGAENSKGLVVLSHGLGCGAESYMAHTLYFVDHGYQVFSFDNTGCHRSGGSDCGGMSQSVLDLDAALSFLEGQERFRDLPLLLFGHSWGGYAVTAILQFDHDVAASVSVAGYNSPVEMTFQWLLERDGPKAWLAYPYLWIFQLLRFGKNANLTALDGINSSDTPVLLLHGIADDIVDCQSTGIAARRGDISNPNVRCIFFMASGHDGHSSLYTSDDSAAYFREVRAAREALAASYGGELPQEAEWEFNETVDSFRMSGLDPSFMAWVLAFFDNAAVPEAGDAPQ